MPKPENTLVAGNDVLAAELNENFDEVWDHLVLAVDTADVSDDIVQQNTFDDVAGSDLSITTQARRVLISFAGAGYIGAFAGNFGELAIQIDGGSDIVVAGGGAPDASSSTAKLAVGFSYISDVLSAAAHTIKLRFRCHTGTNCNFVIAGRFSVVELP